MLDTIQALIPAHPDCSPLVHVKMGSGNPGIYGAWDIGKSGFRGHLIIPTEKMDGNQENCKGIESQDRIGMF